MATLGVASKNVHDRRLDENNGQCDTSRAGLPALRVRVLSAAARPVSAAAAAPSGGV